MVLANLGCTGKRIVKWVVVIVAVYLAFFHSVTAGSA